MTIQRISSGSTEGYQVRVGPRHATQTKFFAVRKHGGVRKALAQAKVAEAAMQLHALPTVSRSGPRTQCPSNNTSGVVGIRPRYAVFADHPYLYFVASWHVNGQASSTAFSAQKHGLLAALKMAMDRREKATGLPCELTPRQAWQRMKHLLADHAG